MEMEAYPSHTVEGFTPFRKMAHHAHKPACPDAFDASQQDIARQ